MIRRTELGELQLVRDKHEHATHDHLSNIFSRVRAEEAAHYISVSRSVAPKMYLNERVTQEMVGG